MTMGRGGDEFYISNPHTLLSCNYPLLYPYPSGKRNRISTMSPTGSGIPAPSPSPQWINFFLIKIKAFFMLERIVAIHYPKKR